MRIVIRLIIVLVLAMAIGFPALIFAGAVGGPSIAAAPEFNFGLVDGLVCPGDAAIEYREGPPTTEFNQPGAVDPFGYWSTTRPFAVSCVRDGTTLDDSLGLQVKALTAVFSIYFLICFLPLFIPLSVLSWILIGRLTRAPRSDDDPAIPTDPA